MLKAKWKHFDITNPNEAWDMVKLFKSHEGILAGAFDTETNGLHIIHCLPFMFQFGWLIEKDGQYFGFTFAIDLELCPSLGKQVIEFWHKLAETLPIYLAHNVKFDLHMLINFGTPYEGANVSDSMFFIRYGHNALTPKHGGPPLQLKPYAVQYLTPFAKDHERLLNAEKSAIVKTLNNKLKIRLQSCGKPPVEYNAKSYTLSVVDDMFKDPIFSADDLPDTAREAYYIWLNDDVPIWLQNKVRGLVDPDDIPYNKLNRENLKKYAHLDIVWVLETWLQLDPVVKARENEKGIEFENRLIRPLLEMERVGFDTNKEYLEQCRVNMKDYIIQRRYVFHQLAGRNIKTGQHATIKQILLDRFKEDVTGTDNPTLEQRKNELIHANKNQTCVEFISVLEELRTLEKWYSTYVIRFLKDLTNDNRLYTTIHQVGTVSGRVTSDFQQFPKDAIKTVDGVELFQPRKMIRVSGGNENAIVYLD